MISIRKEREEKQWNKLLVWGNNKVIKNILKPKITTQIILKILFLFAQI